MVVSSNAWPAGYEVWRISRRLFSVLFNGGSVGVVRLHRSGTFHPTCSDKQLPERKVRDKAIMDVIEAHRKAG